MAPQSGRIGWRPYVSPIQYTLDKFGSAIAAYSLRKLKVSYSGFAIRVRRSSDNTEQNIGFDGGNLDTTALTTFVGSGNGFVTTWYDQSAYGYNITQITAANQPQIVQNGAILLDGTKPTVKFNGTTTILSNSNAYTVSGLQNMSIVSVCTTTADSSILRGLMFYGPDSGWGQVSLSMHATQIGWRFGTGAFNNSTYSGSFNRTVLSVYHYGTTETLRINGTDVSTVTGKLTTIAYTGNQFSMGANYTYGPLNYHLGNISEMIIYSNNQFENRVEIESNMNSYYSTWDSDAEAFIAATTLTGGQANAIRTLVTTLKSSNLWSKMRAIYPFIGGTAAKHKFNLKDPRDLDVAHRLVFSGGWSYWTEGPQASWGIADTKFNPATVLGATSSASLGVYQSGGLNGSGHGAWSNSGTRRMAIFESGGGFIRSQITSAATEAVSPDMRGTTNGFIIANRSSANSNKIWRHGVLQGTNTATETALLPDANITLCNVNGNAASGYANVILYFAYISQGLTDAEVTAMHNAVQTFRISLGYYV
jgi:hypothetical protein